MPIYLLNGPATISGYIAGVPTARLVQFAHDADVLKSFLKKEGRSYLKLTFFSWVSRKHEPSNKGKKNLLVMLVSCLSMPSEERLPDLF
jgi:hypothetical protein